jgi:hypothetical protein
MRRLFAVASAILTLRGLDALSWVMMLPAMMHAAVSLVW